MSIVAYQRQVSIKWFDCRVECPVSMHMPMFPSICSPAPHPIHQCTGSVPFDDSFVRSPLLNQWLELSAKSERVIRTHSPARPRIRGQFYRRGKYEAVCLPPAASLMDGPVSHNLQLFLCDKIAPGFWACRRLRLFAHGLGLGLPAKIHSLVTLA